MVRLTCRACGTPCAAGDDLAGKVLNCPRCREPIRVPGQPPAPPPAAPAPPEPPPPDAGKAPPARGTPLGWRAAVWGVFLAWAAGVTLLYLSGMKEATSAPQQAAGAAMSCFWLILGYTVARAIDSASRP